MNRMIRRIKAMQLWLVGLGIGLGLLARAVWGLPEENTEPLREFTTPIVEPEQNQPETEDEVIDLPIIRPDSQKPSLHNDESGLVPPIKIPGMLSGSPRIDLHAGQLASYLHGASARFEPHGEKVCASGCALSHHPTPRLSVDHFQQLLSESSQAPFDSNNRAFEVLLYYGPQTRKLLDQHGSGSLSPQQRDRLDQELACTHAIVSIRIVDEQGTVRSWLDPTCIPLDRRHVFEMKTSNLQPLVTSGTVKRVGVNHAWARL